MIVSEIKIYNFRKFKSVDGNPGLYVKFHKGLNALIGENDAGKTAVIDAIKLVLMTQSNEYIRVTDEDFYAEGAETQSEFKIDMILSDFSDDEAKNFVEYLMFSKDQGGRVHYSLHLHYRAWKEKNRIFTELRAGDVNDGIVLSGKARDLLKCVYLRPMRDAERELGAGKNSRISQILINHPIFQNSSDHRLKEIISSANGDIEKYFAVEDGKVILTSIRESLAEFNEKGTPNDAQLKTSNIQLKSILESLSLSVPEIRPGLGELNLLCIAAELLLLKHDDVGGLRLALIEELEAHLHPQAQLRLIQYLQKEYQDTGVQIIISTHSTTLASKINLKNIILLKNGNGYDLTEGSTGLEKGDYLFLQRFLDATKANLFFAKGVIMVEGDAENILIPVMAEILGYSLEKYGVSIVNVGSTAFLRYSRIFIRQEGENIGIPVSVVTDCDVKPKFEDDGTFNVCQEETDAKIATKIAHYSQGSVKGFVAPKWTFEYCLALSCLGEDFHKAIHYGKKIKNSDKYSLTDTKIGEADTIVVCEKKAWASLSPPEQAYKIYELMLDNNGKSGLKAIVAQCMASILRWEFTELTDEVTQEKMFDIDLYQSKTDEAKRIQLKERLEADVYLKYIVDAIKYAVGVST